jgi:hypothetical protein
VSVGFVAASNTRMVNYTPLANVGGGSGTITFTGIPSTFDYLYLTASQSFSTQISGNIESYPSIRFNNDSGTNYSRMRAHSINSNGSQTNATGMDFATPGPASSVWPRIAPIQAYIFNYNNTSAFTMMRIKIARLQGNTTVGRNEEAFYYLWRNTATVNTINIVTGTGGGSPAGTFQSWSYFSLYGVSR